jgi:hypothetical protein
MTRITKLVVLVTVVAGWHARADDDQDGRPFSNADLRGPYGFAWDASAGAAHIASVGQFTADGRGNFSGERTVNTGAAVLQQTFHCRYETGANGVGTADCTIMPGGSRETFSTVLVDEGKQGPFISTTAGVVARGVAQKQRP